MIRYEVYHPINKSKLGLSYCNNANITITIPKDIDQKDLYKYDPNNEYYKINVRHLLPKMELIF